jgi:hypothetical protein
MTGMIVDEITVSSKSLRKEISAQVQADSQLKPIWYRWKGEAAFAPGDVILCSVLVPAMKAGGTLVFNGTISKELNSRLPQLQRLLIENRVGLRPIEIEVTSISNGSANTQSYPEPTSGALFYSDVSAFYTLLKNHQQIQDLVFVQNSLNGSGMATIKGKILFKRYASVLKKTFLEIETNSAILMEPPKNRQAFANSLMAIVLAMIFSSRIDHLYIPSANGAGSDPGDRILELLSPLLKEHGTEMIVGDAGKTVGEKIGAIASDPLFMDALRTCWENPYRNYNCGRCAICSRNEKAEKIVKRLGSDEFEKFASGLEYKNQPDSELRN